ncbi:DEAD/DEAH box helicase-like protein [Pseudovirgaria hyperparasitica]|uniref:DEAD/DEAH box helicase-like protein n=1 Tax=Pseudovirgaria hyperparasitica TaxID=470096 RepID=A0A6A6WCS8_9PEZI|nr:DEAD/DEAH box helicase-like protein [Pseudovirgaria hyperparasitica]KAF2760642.1 DEAD/DEAH box helicase-like protein [Pseudovirgaria hyperparasitica]
MYRLFCAEARRSLIYKKNVQTLTQRAFTARVSKITCHEDKKALSPQTPTAIKLRSYQEECIQAVLSYLKDGHRRLGISLATGSGKTVIFTQLIDRIQPPNKRATRTLVLAHRRELVEQAARHCQNAYPHKSVEIEMGNIHASGMADITVASVQSIRSSDRTCKFDPSRYKLVLVDEAHHIVASQYLDVLDHFNLKDSSSSEHGTALVGVSATFSRLDGRQLGQVIDQIVFHKDYIDMIGEKWLSDVIFTTVESHADIRKVGTMPTGDFQAGALSKVVNTDEINEITVRAWMAKAGSRKSTLVFCVDLNHVTQLTATFRKHGYDAQFVTGDTPKKTRSARLDAFRNGEFPVLLNCGVFTEGTDIPNIDCVLLARPTKSRNLLVQMIGRGMRLHANKENCHIIDMVASLNTGIVSTPTLFGLDPASVVENASVGEMKTLRERKEQELDREKQAADLARKDLPTATPRANTSISFTDYDSVADLLEDTAEERLIRRLSQNAWVGVGDDRYVLTTQKGDYLTIEPSDSGFHVKYTQKLPFSAKSKVPFAKPRQVADSETFEHAVHAADTFATEVFQFIFISKHQSWRRTPASSGQLEFLNKFRAEDDKLKAQDITKGRAGDMITKIKHGARGRFNRMEAKKKAMTKQQAKDEVAANMAMREVVSVGPLMHSMPDTSTPIANANERNSSVTSPRAKSQQKNGSRTLVEAMTAHR